MNNEYHYHIDNIFNIFSSYPLDSILNKYHIDKYYQVKQIHSDIIHIIDNNFKYQEGDAIITNKKDIYLLIKTADCLPILIYDNKNKVIGLVHAGWKGVLNKIVLKTINKMIKEYRCELNNLSIYIYPSIRKCHFIVKDDTYNLFKDYSKYIKKDKDNYYIDLQGIIINDLSKLGINNIYDSNICTYCHKDKYYSYRYNHTTKRNYLVVSIRS